MFCMLIQHKNSGNTVFKDFIEFPLRKSVCMGVAYMAGSNRNYINLNIHNGLRQNRKKLPNIFKMK